jgi:hypothetical protein
MRTKTTVGRGLAILAFGLCAAAWSPACGQITYFASEWGGGQLWADASIESDYSDYQSAAAVEVELFDPDNNVIAAGDNEADACGDDGGDAYAEVGVTAETSQAGWYSALATYWVYDVVEEEWEDVGEDYAWSFAYPPGSGPPSIDHIWPTSAVYGAGDGWGAPYGYIGVYGSNLDWDDASCGPVTVSFGTCYWASDTQVNIQYDDSLGIGTYQISITNDVGASSNSVPFTITGDSTPSVSLSNAAWPSPGTTAFSITGSGFGTSPTVTLSDTSIGLSYTPVSDSLINASVTVPSGRSEGVTVTVASSGYNGQGFQAGQQGNSNSGTAQATVTSCSYPNLYVTYTVNGGSPTQISPGGTIYVTADPYMPAISAVATPVIPCAALSGTVSYQLSTADNGGSYGFPSPPPSTLAANQTFSVPTSPFYGGSATISWTYNGTAEPSFTFNILGYNPPTATIQAALSGWGVNIGIHESRLQQFSGSPGPPLQTYGGGNGYGVMQLDTTPGATEDQRWNWQSNISAGQSLLAAQMSIGSTNWQTQRQQWMDWNNVPGNPQVGPANDYWEGSCCVFSMQGTGTYTYDVASGLKNYAGGNYFISWFNVGGGTPYWTFNTSYGTHPDIVYEFCNCGSLATCDGATNGSGHQVTN